MIKFGIATGVYGFNEAPIHESGKSLDVHPGSTFEGSLQ